MFMLMDMGIEQSEFQFLLQHYLYFLLFNLRSNLCTAVFLEENLEHSPGIGFSDVKQGPCTGDFGTSLMVKENDR